jgi:hypothetical protein
VTARPFDVVHMHSPLVAAHGTAGPAHRPPRPKVVYTEHNIRDAYTRPTR